MRKRRWHPKRQDPAWLLVRLRWMVILILFLWIFIGFLRNLEEMMVAYAETFCRNLITQVVSESLYEAQQGKKLIHFTDSESESIKSVIRIDSAMQREYQAALSKAISLRLESIAQKEYPAPLGTVLESHLLLGRGPEIKLRFHPIGSVVTDVHSDLQSAGINQVLYRVVLDLSVQMAIPLPGQTHIVAHTQQIVLEEFLLSGEVPYVYSG